jgi:hypothetical protein
MVVTFSINDFTELKVFALIFLGEPNLFAKENQGEQGYLNLSS